MSARKLTLASAVILLTLGVAADSFADISNAAVLFLRIAPGSRAAGMGESFVAIADDATATHWNPAGLGNYPLSDTWIEAQIPESFRPVKAIASVSTGGRRNYLNYDVWALTPTGLIRYDNKHWFTEEVFSTRTDETVEQKVRAYFNVTDDNKLAQMVERVCRANNQGSLEELQTLKDEILASVPEDYPDREALELNLDSLMVCYHLCRIKWDKVKDVSRLLEDGLKDSLLNENESERIRFAVERSRSRFIPEELKIPYDALFGGKLTAIASSGEVLLVGSSDGLARYSGTSWQVMPLEDKMASSSVTALHTLGASILVGTNKGIAVFNGLTIDRLTTPESALPEGNIQAIGGSALTDLYAVLNDDLYHYDGRQWRNTTAYTVAVDDSIEKIAERLSLYGSDLEKQKFVDKYRLLAAAAPAVEAAPVIVGEDTAVEENPVSVNMESAANETEAAQDSALTGVDATLPGAVGSSVEGAVAAEAGIAGIDFPLNPGDVIQVPFLAEIKGRVKALYVDMGGQIWLGTDYGVYYRSSQAWNSPGYREHVIADGETLDDLALSKGPAGSEAAEEYMAVVRETNDLTDRPLEDGEKIGLPANPAAGRINRIAGDGGHLLFATESGLIEFDGTEWARSELRGFAQTEAVDIAVLGNETWIASEKKIVIKGRGRSEVTLMHVNWLPELADDLYYEFLSAVTQKQGWGTFGGSVTYISYGKFARTNADSPVIVGEFESFDIAFTASYGTSLTSKLKGGLSAKVIYSRLTDQGAGEERGSGTSTGFGIDIGFLYLLNSRLTWGLAITNIGPEMAYIDAAQSDDLPRNLAFGFAYKLLQSEYNHLIVTAEINKMLVGFDDKASEELKQTVLNGGLEFTYARLISARAGYIYDQEGAIKTATLGVGLALFDRFKFDFSYIPSQENFSLANTMRISLGVLL